MRFSSSCHVASALLLTACADATRPDLSSEQRPGTQGVATLAAIAIAAPTALTDGIGMSINDIGQVAGLQAPALHGELDLPFRWTPYGNTTRRFAFLAGAGAPVLAVLQPASAAMHPKYGALVSGGVFWSPTSGSHAIPLPVGYDTVLAYDINASGVIVGRVAKPTPPQSDTLITAPTIWVGFVWVPGASFSLLGRVPVRLGTISKLTAVAINSHGVIAGVSQTIGGAPASGVIWSSAAAPAVQLANPISDINDCGELSQIQDNLTNGVGPLVAFETGAGGFVRNLASEVQLAGFSPSVDYSLTHRISQTGWVAGSIFLFASGESQAVLWRPDGGTPLILPPLPGDAQAEAYAINSRGEVTGTSYSPDNPIAVEWTVPATTFAGTVALIRAQVATVNGLSSAARTQLEADLDAAASDAKLGYVTPARTHFAAFESHLEAGGAQLSTRDRALLSDAAICLSESLTS